MARPRLTDSTFDNARMGVNPFTRDLTIPVREKASVKETKAVTRTADGTIVGFGDSFNIEQKFYAEITSFTKVFHSKVHRTTVASLPARGKELLIWMMMELKSGQDYIVINIERYKSENRCSHSTYSRAIDDLIEINILQPTRWQAVYWINPAFMFSGNRINKFKDNIVVWGKREIKEKVAELTDELK